MLSLIEPLVDRVVVGRTVQACVDWVIVGRVNINMSFPDTLPVTTATLGCSAVVCCYHHHHPYYRQAKCEDLSRPLVYCCLTHGERHSIICYDG